MYFKEKFTNKKVVFQWEPESVGWEPVQGPLLEISAALGQFSDHTRCSVPAP